MTFRSSGSVRRSLPSHGGGGGGGGGLGLCRAAVPPHRVCRVTRVCIFGGGKSGTDLHLCAIFEA